MNWITIPVAAAAANRSISTIYNWIAAGRLHTRIDATGTTIVKRDDVINLEPTIRKGRPRNSARPPQLHRNTP